MCLGNQKQEGDTYMHSQLNLHMTDSDKYMS